MQVYRVDSAVIVVEEKSNEFINQYIPKDNHSKRKSSATSTTYDKPPTVQEINTNTQNQNFNQQKIRELTTNRKIYAAEWLLIDNILPIVHDCQE